MWTKNLCPHFDQSVDSPSSDLKRSRLDTQRRMGLQGQKEKACKQRKARGPRWALWETLLACHVVIAIRNKYAQGISGPELMREYNRLYAELADEWEKNNLLLDHNGLTDRRVSTSESKQHRISVVQSSTRSTPIPHRF